MQLGGVGVGLPYPNRGFPDSTAQGYRSGLAVALGSNKFTLQPGGILQIPPGNFFVQTGSASYVQFLDPVTGGWTELWAAGAGGYVPSDGTNFRVINPQAVPTGATITAAGSGYVQASTTVSASSGGSTWQPIIGGAITAFTVGTDSGGTTGGTNFSLAPIVVIDAPLNPGVQATAHATVSGGAVTAVTVDKAGAGYVGAPNVRLIPNPEDPNLGSITIPVVTATVGDAGQLTGLIVLSPGAPVHTTAPTLTVTGVGSGATATVVWADGTTEDQIVLQLLPGT